MDRVYRVAVGVFIALLLMFGTAYAFLLINS
jgi:hypothetical protein